MICRHHNKQVQLSLVRFQSTDDNFSKYCKKIPVTFPTRDGAGKFNMDLNVYDGYESSMEGRPLVLALHGAPGNCRDFQKLADLFMEYNIRFIVPDFPGKNCILNK